MVTKTKKIFVGGLSAQTTVEDVKKYFSSFGKVSTRVLPLACILCHFWIHVYLLNKPFEQFYFVHNVY